MTRPEGSDSMRMWGGLLRRYRQAAGISREELAAHVGYSLALVASIERGNRMPSDNFVYRAEDKLKTNGLLAEAAQHLSRERLPGAAVEPVEEEQRARAVWAYDTHVLHPLLRTEAYTRALLGAHWLALSDPEIDAEVAAERDRQARMTAEPVCLYAFIVEEWILHRQTGGPAAMKAQLDHLAALAQWRNVTVQVLPTSRQAHPGLNGPITLLRQPEHHWLALRDFHGTHYPLYDRSRLVDLQDCYTHLRSLALPPDDTLRLIRGLADCGGSG